MADEELISNMNLWHIGILFAVVCLIINEKSENRFPIKKHVRHCFLGRMYGFLGCLLAKVILI